jgi:glutathione-regulated potassium-efflux system ancillary protein KefC
VVLGMGQIGSGAYLRLIEGHGLRVLGVDNDPTSWPRTRPPAAT